MRRPPLTPSKTFLVDKYPAKVNFKKGSLSENGILLEADTTPRFVYSPYGDLLNTFDYLEPGLRQRNFCKGDKGIIPSLEETSVTFYLFRLHTYAISCYLSWDEEQHFFQLKLCDGLLILFIYRFLVPVRTDSMRRSEQAQVIYVLSRNLKRNAYPCKSHFSFMKWDLRGAHYMELSSYQSFFCHFAPSKARTCPQEDTHSSGVTELTPFCVICRNM